MKNILLLFIIFGITNSIYSQEIKTNNKKPFIVFKPDSIDDGRPLLTPFVTPGYTPELGGMLAIGGYFSFKANRENEISKRSSIPLSFSFTSTGALVFNMIPIIYLMDEKLIIEGDYWYKSMPDHYFGVGYLETIDKPKDTKTSYHRDWWWINPRIFWKLKKDWFIGANIDFNYTYGSDASAEVMADPHYSRYNNRPFNSGLGLIARYDSRDLPKNTYTGLLVEYSSTLYGDFLGGNNDYQIHQIDIRKFFTVWKTGRVLALQAKARIGVGDVPYGEMSQLGTPFDLRGYLWGRLRDKSLVYGIAEYRHKLYIKSKPSRHSLVAWTGIGTIFNEDSKTYYGVPNLGFGYRLEIQPRVSVRLDYGFGMQTQGFYFNFQQAF